MRLPKLNPKLFNGTFGIIFARILPPLNAEKHLNSLIYLAATLPSSTWISYVIFSIPAGVEVSNTKGYSGQEVFPEEIVIL